MTTDTFTLSDMYLRPAGTILCLATHSKLGLSSFVESLTARAELSDAAIGSIIDGGIIGFPVADYLPADISAPDRVIIMHHPQDPPRLLTRFSSELLPHFHAPTCHFHEAGTDLDLVISY